MSAPFTATAIRIAIVKLLKDKTLAGARVHDSVIAPLDMTITDKPEPMIIVSTEDEESSITNFDICSGSRSVDLIIEIAIADQIEMEVKTDDGGVENVIDFVIPATDAGMEMSIALITRQIHKEIIHGSEPWGDVIRALIPRITKVESRRGAGSDKKTGTRFAARQIVYTIDVIGEPPFGVKIENESSWGKFLTAASSDDELNPISMAFRSVFEGEEVPEWDQMRTVMGITKSAAYSIGIGPAIGMHDIHEGPAVLDEIDDEVGSINDESVGENLP